MSDQIVELIDVQDYLGQQFLNVFHYVDTTGAADPLDLAAAYVTNIIPPCKAMQSTELTHTAIKVRQVYPTAALVQEVPISPSIAGTDGNTPADSYMAYSFKFILSPSTVVLSGGFTGHIKRGGCRLGGITMSDVGENALNSGKIALGVTWAAAMLTNLATDFQLVVASYLIGNPSGPGVPRDRSDTVTSYTLVNAISDMSPSTQNTRKVLRGRTF
jgi:hypothetical protein